MPGPSDESQESWSLGVLESWSRRVCASGVERVERVGRVVRVGRVGRIAKERWIMSEWRCVFVASGEVHAQQVRAFLEAAGIPTEVQGESLRNTHGLTIDGLGAVQISVAGEDAERARTLLESADAGDFRLPDDAIEQENTS